MKATTHLTSVETRNMTLLHRNVMVRTVLLLPATRDYGAGENEGVEDERLGLGAWGLGLVEMENWGVRAAGFWSGGGSELWANLA